MNKAFTEISAGIDSAIAHAKGEPTHNVVEYQTKTIDVKAIREKIGMSQQQFCSTFGISLGTLRHWEQGLRTPRGTAKVLLKVIERNPKAIIEAIA
jgi:putative transcriptional regulator